MMDIDEYNVMDGEALFMEDGTEFIPEGGTEMMFPEDGTEMMLPEDDMGALPAEDDAEVGE